MLVLRHVAGTNPPGGVVPRQIIPTPTAEALLVLQPLLPVQVPLLNAVTPLQPPDCLCSFFLAD